MAGVKDRLPMLFEIRSENRQVLRDNFNNPERDREGKCSASLIGDLRFFAVAEFVLHGSTQKFREQLSEAADIQKRMFSRIDQGEPIDSSYNSVLGYKGVLNALAANSFTIAEWLSNRVWRTSVRDDVHQFDDAFGRALCSILVSKNDAPHYVGRLKAVCESDDADFLGYAQLFQAVLDNNSVSASDALAKVVAGHKRQSVGDGVFVNTEDEALCVWGVGVANLARHFGIDITSPDKDLIPNALLVSEQ